MISTKVPKATNPQNQSPWPYIHPCNMKCDYFVRLSSLLWWEMQCSECNVLFSLYVTQILSYFWYFCQDSVSSDVIPHSPGWAPNQCAAVAPQAVKSPLDSATLKHQVAPGGGGGHSGRRQLKMCDSSVTVRAMQASCRHHPGALNGGQQTVCVQT